MDLGPGAGWYRSCPCGIWEAKKRPCPSCSYCRWLRWSTYRRKTVAASGRPRPRGCPAASGHISRAGETVSVSRFFSPQDGINGHGSYTPKSAIGDWISLNKNGALASAVLFWGGYTYWLTGILMIFF